MSRILKLFSTSTIHGSGYLDYAEAAIRELFEGHKQLLFVPYARPGGATHDAYHAIAQKKFAALGFTLDSVHLHKNPADAIRQCEGLFIGGGNTFVLLRDLYQHRLIDIIRQRVAEGMPYMGTSAGSNVAGRTIGTTNDMPIVYPPSFAALGLVDFNLNPHYLDPDPNSTHKGETRETRIREFHCFNQQVVVGLREGSWLTIHDNVVTLEGTLHARIFSAGKEAVEVPPGEINPQWLTT